VATNLDSMKDCAKQMRDACQTRNHAIFLLKFTNMETAMLSVTSATKQSPSIILLEDLVLRGGGEGA